MILIADKVELYVFGKDKQTVTILSYVVSSYIRRFLELHNPLFRLPHIIEFWVLIAYVHGDLLPLFDVKYRVTLGWLANNYPVVCLAVRNLLLHFVRIGRLRRSDFVSDWTAIVIIAVIYECG